MQELILCLHSRQASFTVYVKDIISDQLNVETFDLAGNSKISICELAKKG